MTNTTLHLYKQNFKFSSAHFLIFDEQRAEMLHGHNYQVKIDLKSKAIIANEGLKNSYLIDFHEIKALVKSKLDLWDEHVLLPGQNVEMKFQYIDNSVEVFFRDRKYCFPKNEVVLLPITNTSVEQLSLLLANEFAKNPLLKIFSEISVTVEETQGQSASTSVAI